MIHILYINRNSKTVKIISTVLLLMIVIVFECSAQLTWSNAIAQPPFGARFACTSFSINGKGYVIGGCNNASYNPPYLNEVWEYDPVTDSWTQKANYPGGSIYHPAAFVIGNFAYVGMGLITAGNCSGNFYKYDPSTDTWTPIASFPGSDRYDVIEFVLNGEGYVCTGSTGGPPYEQDCYKYNSGTNVWTQIADFPGTAGRSGGSGINDNGLGYGGFGQYDSGSGIFLSDFYSYDSGTNSWTAKTSLPYGNDDARLIKLCNNYYLIAGINGSGALNKVTGYNVGTNAWTVMPNGPFTSRWFAFSFTINGSGYFGTGKNSSTVYSDFWKITAPVSLTLNDTSMCSGQPVQLNAGGGFSQYTWSPATGLNSSTGNIVNANPQATTTYTLIATNGAGCGDTAQMTVTVFTSPTVIATGDTDLCITIPVQLNATGATNYQWVPSTGLSSYNISNPIANTISSVTYTVIGSDSTGCFTTDEVSINILVPPVSALPDTTIFCDQSIQLYSGVTTTGFNFHWEPAYGLSDSTSTSPVAAPDINTTYTLVIETADGCQVKYSMAINVDAANIYIPNAFSPNGDDRNDLYSIIYSCGFELYYFRIYNRWGQLVWQTNDITEGWDGLFHDMPCGIGVYAWVISGSNTYTHSSVFMKGNVTLVR